MQCHFVANFVLVVLYYALADLGDHDFRHDHHRKNGREHQRDAVPLEQVDRGVQRHAKAAGADQAQHGRFAHVDVPADAKMRSGNYESSCAASLDKLASIMPLRTVAGYEEILTTFAAWETIIKSDLGPA